MRKLSNVLKLPTQPTIAGQPRPSSNVGYESNTARTLTETRDTSMSLSTSRDRDQAHLAKLGNLLLEHSKVLEMWGKSAEDVLSSVPTWAKYLSGYTLEQIDRGIIQAAKDLGGKFPSPPAVLLALEGAKNKKISFDKTYYLELKKRAEKALQLSHSAAYYTYSLTNQEAKYVREYERQELAKVEDL